MHECKEHTNNSANCHCKFPWRKGLSSRICESHIRIIFITRFSSNIRFQFQIYAAMRLVIRMAIVSIWTVTRVVFTRASWAIIIIIVCALRFPSLEQFFFCKNSAIWCQITYRRCWANAKFHMYLHGIASNRPSYRRNGLIEQCFHFFIFAFSVLIADN